MATLFTIKLCLWKGLEGSYWKTQKLLPVLISHKETAYVKEKFICKTGGLISDIIEVSVVFNIGSFLAAMDIKKTFDSLNHSFLLVLLKKFGFGTNLLILNKSKSWVTSSGKATQHFQLNRRAQQGDPISTYLFILVMEALFTLKKSGIRYTQLLFSLFRLRWWSHLLSSQYWLSDRTSNDIFFQAKF